MDFEFWQHIHDFPIDRESFPLSDFFTEVMGILNYWRIGSCYETWLHNISETSASDSTTSLDSTASYDDSELDSLVASAEHLQGLTTNIPYPDNLPNDCPLSCGEL